MVRGCRDLDALRPPRHGQLVALDVEELDGFLDVLGYDGGQGTAVTSRGQLTAIMCACVHVHQESH